MKVYEVIKSRKSEFPNPITVHKGEEVLCIKESYHEDSWAGWILCQTKNNKGWVPHQIVAANDKAGIILEDYCAEEFDLEIGEILISNKEMNSWIWCHKESNSNKMAWAPLNHLKIVQ